MASPKNSRAGDSSKLKNLLKENVYDKLKASKEFSLKIGVLHKGQQKGRFSYGANYKFYDLASMTKAIFTSSAFLHLYPELIPQKVSQIVPWLPASHIKVKDLLSHSSGLPGHLKLYLKLKDLKSSYEKEHYLKKVLREEFSKIKVASKKVEYSDIGYYLLGEVLKSHTLKPLNWIWEKTQSELSYPKGFSFEKPPIAKTAPTEKCSWRKKKIQAEVFDDNAYAYGGVNPHTGLFGDIDDMLEYGKILKKNYSKNPKMYKKICDGWAYGFMVPSGKLSTAGSFFSRQSIGHLGFTGTSFWYDPQKDLYVCVLCNRTYPDRNDFSFNKFRPVIHDTIYQFFTSSKT